MISIICPMIISGSRETCRASYFDIPIRASLFWTSGASRVDTQRSGKAFGLRRSQSLESVDATTGKEAEAIQNTFCNISLKIFPGNSNPSLVNVSR